MNFITCLIPSIRFHSMKKLIESVKAEEIKDKIRFIVLAQGYSPEERENITKLNDCFEFIFMEKEKNTISHFRNILFKNIGECKYLCLFDDDNVFGKNSIDHLLKIGKMFENDDFFGACCLTNITNTLMEERIEKEYEDIVFYSALSPSNIGLDCGLFISKNAFFDAIGLIPENIFFGEDSYIITMLFISGYDIFTVRTDIKHEHESNGLSEVLNAEINQKKFDESEKIVAEKFLINLGYVIPTTTYKNVLSLYSYEKRNENREKIYENLEILDSNAKRYEGYTDGIKNIKYGKILGTIKYVNEEKLKTGNILKGTIIRFYKRCLEDVGINSEYFDDCYFVLRGYFTAWDKCEWHKFQENELMLENSSKEYFEIDGDKLLDTAKKNNRSSKLSWDKSEYGGIKIIVFNKNKEYITEFNNNYQLNIFQNEFEIPANAKIKLKGYDIYSEIDRSGKFCLENVPNINCIIECFLAGEKKREFNVNYEIKEYYKLLV